MKTVKTDHFMQIAQEAAEQHMREHQHQPYVPLSVLSLVVDKAVRKAGLHDNLFRFEGLYSLTTPSTSYTRWIKRRARGLLAASNPFHRHIPKKRTPAQPTPDETQKTVPPKRIRITSPHPARTGSRGKPNRVRVHMTPRSESA